MSDASKIKICGALMFIAVLSGMNLPAISLYQFIMYSIAVLTVLSAWRINRG